MIEDATERRHLESKVALLDRCIWANGGHDLGSRKQLAVPLDHDGEQIERPPADRHRRQGPALAAPKQAALVELKPLEQESAAQGECAHASHPAAGSEAHAKAGPRQRAIFQPNLV
ncbi:MAG: hypothetical protein ACREE9_00250 [Stellaceae bacterium]